MCMILCKIFGISYSFFFFLVFLLKYFFLTDKNKRINKKDRLISHFMDFNFNLDMPYRLPEEQLRNNFIL